MLLVGIELFIVLEIIGGGAKDQTVGMSDIMFTSFGDCTSCIVVSGSTIIDDVFISAAEDNILKTKGESRSQKVKVKNNLNDKKKK